jgi:hypothetical protein
MRLESTIAATTMPSRRDVRLETRISYLSMWMSHCPEHPQKRKNQLLRSLRWCGAECGDAHSVLCGEIVSVGGLKAVGMIVKSIWNRGWCGRRSWLPASIKCLRISDCILLRLAILASMESTCRSPGGSGYRCVKYCTATIVRLDNVVVFQLSSVEGER